MDAVEILKLKPGLRLEDDVTAWAFERSGLYSVRSCYRMLKRENDQLEAFKINESESSLNSPWWTKLWKLKIPPKVPIFWWRVLNNFLPCKAELKRRHVAQEDHCESCGEAGESVFHIAISCPLAVHFGGRLKTWLVASFDIYIETHGLLIYYLGSFVLWRRQNCLFVVPGLCG
jgi:hypothetical protein